MVDFQGFFKKTSFAFLLILLLLISSCSGKSSASQDAVRTGTGAISMAFLPNNPPNEIRVSSSSDEKFLLVMQANNIGAYPQPEDQILAPEGKLYLTGFDKRILKFEAKDYGTGDKIDIQKTALSGKSTINPNGGQDIITFEGTVYPSQLNVERYDPIIMATACFKYETVAAPQVCIDPFPYADNIKKVCNPAHVTMQSQGAPIAVTQLNVEPFSSKTQFKITIKNIGTGQALSDAYVGQCGAEESPSTYNKDIDRIHLDEVTIAGSVLDCGPFANDGSSTNSRSSSGYIKLINGEGYVICELSSDLYGDTKTSYTTPMEIRLSYTYKVSTERPLTIIKEPN